MILVQEGWGRAGLAEVPLQKALAEVVQSSCRVAAEMLQRGCRRAGAEWSRGGAQQVQGRCRADAEQVQTSRCRASS